MPSNILRNQRQPIRYRQELQCVIHDHHRGVVDVDIANVGRFDGDRDFAVVGIDQLAAAFDHGSGKVDGDDFTARFANAGAHGECRRAQRAAQVVASGIPR